MSILNSNNTTMDKDELNKVLERTIGWINNCDTKVSIILSGIGVMFGIFLATDHLRKFLAIIKWMFDNSSFLAFVYLAFILISIILVLLGVSFFVNALLSRTNILKFKEKKVSLVSLLFFSTISDFSSVEEYKKEVEKCEEKQYIEDLITQIYVCSLICNGKFKYYKRGLLFSIIGVALYCLMNFIGVLVV